MAEPAGPEPWSHNAHYHPVILAAVPGGCERALDVGCGTGALTRSLRRLVPHVAGIDRDERSIELASSHPGAAGVAYILGDFLAAPFPPASFDLVTAVASLHHMDAEAALARMRDLLRPGGVLAVIGLARPATPADRALALPAVIGTRLHLLASGSRRGRRPAGNAAAQAHVPPVIWPPSMSYRGVRHLAGRLLPGARYRRHMYWRYSLVWAKPAPAGPPGAAMPGAV